ncbi:hypothetical protein [Deinococcus ruber]|uniref:Uncharacterized protein n=1 Tax=Deinococcus ruber TaxID=1848197 RepID=A0A918F9P5_9DEIO|nr:hypothetical protein [Deinococcus ruber]GGR22516.1 hypothetical protein GCM10008957_38180 [Deinococcus ruber]
MKITEQSQDVLPPEPDPRASNAARHGLGSETVPTWEREAYAVHVQAVRASSGAQGYLQERLADRAALALWRLDRVARWEAGRLETEQRRFFDHLRSTKQEAESPYGSVASSPLDARPLRESMRALAQLTGESVTAFVSDPASAEHYAQGYDDEAAAWEALRAGADPASYSNDTAATLGVELLTALQEEWNLNAGRVARALLGRKATRQEAQDIADWNYEVGPGDLGGLVTEAARLAGAAWDHWLMTKQYEASSKAIKIRMIAARLPALLQQELAQSTEPKTPDLEKITRYEAHLERVLYRALHELEAARRERQGQDTPGPVRMVLDERADP